MTTAGVSEVLYDRFAKLHHAANLKDFQTYCDEGALLARSELTRATATFTPFFSDELDKKRGVWERVFGNLQDFNALFWAAEGCVPNAYGPITLIFERTAWRVTNDVAVTRENAASENFDLATFRMNAETVASCYERKGRWWRLKCNGLEVSLGIQSLPLSYLERIIVDPVLPDLYERVKNVSAAAGINGSNIQPRKVGSGDLNPDRLAVFNELIDWSRRLAGQVPSAHDLRRAVPPALQTWAGQLPDTLWGPLCQWLKYTYKGTLS